MNETMHISGEAPKKRNVVAIAAFQRTGAGKHRDKKRHADKTACRGKVRDFD